MTPVFELRGLRKVYGARTVLAVDALDIAAGEILAVVGPSGAGKSTLLRLLNFLEAPTAGTLTYGGRAAPPEPPLDWRREVTTVFQRPVMLGGTVRDNVAFGLRLRGEAAEARVAAALERVGLTALAGQGASRLSGGEAQRTALARALVLRPRVLLLDEPTANLDPYHVSLIEDIVREQNRAQATTVVMVTHNVFQARRLAQRAAFLLSGSLVEASPIEDFFNAPRDARTAAFVRGEMVY